MMNMYSSILAAPFLTTALAWAGLAAVGIPIAIHLLSRLRRRHQPWGAMRFLIEAYRRHRQRLRIEQLLLLLVRCLLVLILGLALAGPILSGIIGRFSRGLGTNERTVHIVIDDSLSTHANVADTATRFDELRDMVLALVGELTQNDRLTIWRSARPYRQLDLPPASDGAAVRSLIESLRPRYGRSELPACLEAVYQALLQDELTADRSMVVILSDFSEGNEYLKRNVPRRIQGLGDEAELVVVQPEPGAANIQISATSPRRAMVVANTASTALVPVRIQCRRFDTGSTALSCGLEIRLLDSLGATVADAARTIQWSVGQRETTVNVELPLNPAGGDMIGGRGALYVIQADLDPGSQPDAIDADDRNWSVVEVRQRLMIALLDESIGSGFGGDGSLVHDGKWVSLALSPQVTGDPGVVEVVELQPAGVDPASLESFDAVMVMRPDLLAGVNWQQLSQYAQGGGLVWIFSPDQTSSANWSQAMVRAMHLDWQVAIEPVQLDEVAEDDSEQAMSVEIDTSVTLPEALSLLAADFESLCRPVRVLKWFGIEAPADQLWLALDVDTSLSRYRGLMAVSDIGSGSVVLLGSPLDDSWTNLHTKPLFVPLLHESLRGLLGRDRRVERQVVAGDRPVLDHRWSGVSALVPTTIGLAGSDDQVDPIDLVSRQGMLVTASAVESPGVYTAADGGVSRKLAVNIDPDAGDCRTVSEEQYVRWLNGFGEGRWSYLDRQSPGSVFGREVEQVNIGRPMLWLVLALLLMETALARWFSHAGIANRLSFTGRLMTFIRHLRHAHGTLPGRSSSRRPAERRAG